MGSSYPVILTQVRLLQCIVGSSAQLSDVSQHSDLTGNASVCWCGCDKGGLLARVWKAASWFLKCLHGGRKGLLLTLTLLGGADCLYSALCSPCASYTLRKRALHNDMSRYVCCAGYYPCAGRCGESNAPECCLCIEVKGPASHAPSLIKAKHTLSLCMLLSVGLRRNMTPRSAARL